MFLDDDLPKDKLPQTFPRKLDGLSVTQMKDYKVELLVEIAKIDKEIEARGGMKNAAEDLFKK